MMFFNLIYFNKLLLSVFQEKKGKYVDVFDKQYDT